MSFKPTFKSDKYDDGRTKQSFKDSTDINKLIYKHAKAGTLSHLEKYQGQYGDFSGFDFFEAQTRLAKAKSIFDELPAETRREFGNNPANFFELVAGMSPADVKKALPELAKKGRQLPDILKKAQQPPPAAASEPQASVPNTPPAGSEVSAPAPSDGASG
jgi:hypothetical protein